MASFDDIIRAHLENVRPTTDGWVAACPACRGQGGDKQGNHLRIWRGSHAFNCAKAGPEDREHNKLVRAVLYQDADPFALAALDLQIVDPEPKLDVDKVYPEDMLARLVPDHRYWVGRGISEDVLRKLEGGLAPPDEKSKLSNRYIFPVRDDKGRITGFTGRLVSEASFGPTHKHLVRASRAVYPIHVAGEHIRRTRKVAFTEGIGDGLTWASHGMWNWLLLFGLNLNARILGFLVSVNPTHIVISTNNDAVGDKGHSVGNETAEKLRRKLVPFFGEERVLIHLPPRKDWNQCQQENPAEVAEFKAWFDGL